MNSAEAQPVNKLSIVTPAFHEAQNLPVFYERLLQIDVGIDWEWVIVDDHSRDDTFAVAQSIASKDSRVRVFRLSRNSGAHTAIYCGLDKALGNACAVMAADMQDPPEMLPEMLAKWQDGAQVVWALRQGRPGETKFKLITSRIYHWTMGMILGDNVAAAGADFVLLDLVVKDSLLKFREQNASILGLLMWMGFRQQSVTYKKSPRLYGKSGYTFLKSLKLVKNSIMSFSVLPLRIMSYIGTAIASAGALYAVIIVLFFFFGKPITGWPSIMVAILVIGGFQLIMLGMIGEYLWIALEEIRSRPRYLIENSCDNSLISPPVELQNFSPPSGIEAGKNSNISYEGARVADVSSPRI